MAQFSIKAKNQSVRDITMLTITFSMLYETISVLLAICKKHMYT